MKKKSGAVQLDSPRGFSVQESPSGPLLAFLTDAGGVFQWAVALDAGDDPPVYVRWLGSSEWEHASDRFSVFGYTIVFDLQHWRSATAVNWGRDAWGEYPQAWR